MKNFLINFTILFCGFIFAQNDANSVKILEDVRKNYESKTSYKIQFQYELNNVKQKINQKEIGIAYSQKEKYNINILGINQIFDGKKLYQISDEDKEITISKSNSDDILTPTKIFDSYKKGFLIEKSKTGTVNKKSVQLIKLIPTDKKNKSKEIILAIDTKQKQLVQMIENNKDGSIITLNIISFDDKTKLNPNLFSFDKNQYKNYVITNLD